LSDLYLVFACLFSCTALFVSISQVIGCENRLRNDLLCVGWGVKLYSLTHQMAIVFFLLYCVKRHSVGETDVVMHNIQVGYEKLAVFSHRLAVSWNQCEIGVLR